MRFLLVQFLVGFVLHTLQTQPPAGAVHYKLESKSISPVGTSYIVCSITFYVDSCFVWREMKFHKMKYKRHCIPADYDVEKGRWSRCGDTIMCNLNHRQRIERFYLKRNKLYYLTYPFKGNFFPKKKFAWKKIRDLNSDSVFN